MPESGYAVTGPLLAAICGTLDPFAIASWTAVCQVLATWIPANAVVNPGLMVATAPGVVSGLGTVTLGSSAAVLGPLLAVAAGSPPTDAFAIAKWTVIATHIYTEWNTNITVQGSTFVAVPTTGGPITGTASLVLTAPLLGILFATLATDIPGIAFWTLIGTTMEAQFITLGASAAIPLPIGMTSPSGGGPLAGTGTIL